jgi:carbamoyltransferase
MRILGLNAYAHDAGIALIRDGMIECVLEEERLDRVKKSRSFPAHAIREYLFKEGIGLDDIDYVVFPWRAVPFVTNALKLAFKAFPVGLNLIRPRVSPNMNIKTAIQFALVERELKKSFSQRLPRRIRQIPHHLCHAAGAHFTSPFDSSAVLVMDGYGENVSTSFYACRGNRIEPIYRNRFFDSMGILYSLITLHLGYRTVMDEGKVMALAAYGTDALVEEFRKIVRLRPRGEYEFDYSYLNYQKRGEIKPFTPKFESIFGPPRRTDEPIGQRQKDLARALQITLEEAVLHTLRGLAERVETRNVCFTGGTALNCLVNGRILGETPFEKVYVPPNPSDSGVALGAALYQYHAVLDKPREDREFSPFAGPGYTDQEIESVLRDEGAVYTRCEDPCEEATRPMAQGKVIGWFQGRMEMGPRALGNRSILADPRRPDIRDHLNKNAKRREWYRPYSAVVLEEKVGDIFKSAGLSPYMSFTTTPRPGFARAIPGVMHVDGTCRLQTVGVEQNPKFWRLIHAFYKLTGLPLVLNTSMNVQEPIVCCPENALTVLKRGGLDVLFMENFRVTGTAASGDGGPT